jgi:ribosome maturation factor RimP
MDYKLVAIKEYPEFEGKKVEIRLADFDLDILKAFKADLLSVSGWKVKIIEQKELE